MQIRIRKQIFPKRFGDILCFLLIVVFLPIVAFFDVVVVVPAIHTPGEFMHTFILTIAMFLLFNIKGNMFAAMMVDTSIDGLASAFPQKACAKGWLNCEYCMKLAPPRSYHCKACNKCILKRDHHCVFTGCCIGQHNIRYFALFLIYMFIGSLISFLYLSYYLFWLRSASFRKLFSLYKMLCPVLMIAHGSKWDNFSLVFYNLNILALVISSILLVYHGVPMIKGGTSYERRLNYPYGKDLYTNLRAIFGKRMYIAWISPFFSSDLLEDDVNLDEASDALSLKRLSRQRQRSQKIEPLE